MSDGTKVGLFLFVLWVFGFIFVGLSNASQDFKMSYLLLPIWGPLAAIVVLTIGVWVIEQVEKIRHR